MSSQLLLAIDAGTTGVRALLYGASASPVAAAYQEFKQYYPRPGWVEHDAEEIVRVTQQVIRKALSASRRPASLVKAIGITNQRETTVLWDCKSGRALHRAIVWQDRRTAPLCETLKKEGHEAVFRKRTGLVLDPYFSGTKIEWLLRNLQLKQKAKTGKVLFGTIDTWLLWHLTGGSSHATDVTNASRTLLYNIQKLTWDRDLLELLNIPAAMLPKVLHSGDCFGKTAGGGALPAGIPVFAMLGDQQAALYGQACYQKGTSKNTYGTGCFVVIHAGNHYQAPPPGLLTTIACDAAGGPAYAFEGSIFIAGAGIQWLRDGLRFFEKAAETQKIAMSVADTGGVTVIPAFVGLGSPYWNPHARGMISGLTRGTTRAHIVRATLEALAHQTADVVDAALKKAKTPIRFLKADGGATANDFLMQFQADILQRPVLVSHCKESTAWGAAKLAGIRSGFWRSREVLDKKMRYRKYVPRKSRLQVQRLREVWSREIARVQV